jgi:hypothetical protein
MIGDPRGVSVNAVFPAIVADTIVSVSDAPLFVSPIFRLIGF